MSSLLSQYSLISDDSYKFLLNVSRWYNDLMGYRSTRKRKTLHSPLCILTNISTVSFVISFKNKQTKNTKSATKQPKVGDMYTKGSQVSRLGSHKRNYGKKYRMYLQRKLKCMDCEHAVLSIYCSDFKELERVATVVILGKQTWALILPRKLGYRHTYKEFPLRCTHTVSAPALPPSEAPAPPPHPRTFLLWDLEFLLPGLLCHSFPLKHLSGLSEPLQCDCSHSQ